MSENTGMRKFEIVFHILVTLFAFGIITAYVLKEIQVFYVVIGVLIAGNSLFRLVKLLNNKETAS